MSKKINQRYEIVFITSQPLGPKLGLKAALNVVRCDKKNVKYRINRWNQFKDLTDLQRSGR